MKRGSASRSYVISADARLSRALGAYLADIDESAHERLVAQSVDSLLSLLPCSIFNDSNPWLAVCFHKKMVMDLPASLYNQRPKALPSIQHSIKNQRKRKDQ